MVGRHARGAGHLARVLERAARPGYMREGRGTWPEYELMTKKICATAG